jgi:hypothetical protein
MMRKMTAVPSAHEAASPSPFLTRHIAQPGGEATLRASWKPQDDLFSSILDRAVTLSPAYNEPDV